MNSYSDTILPSRSSGDAMFATLGVALAVSAHAGAIVIALFLITRAPSPAVTIDVQIVLAEPRNGEPAPGTDASAEAPEGFSADVTPRAAEAVGDKPPPARQASFAARPAHKPTAPSELNVAPPPLSAANEAIDEAAHTARGDRLDGPPSSEQGGAHVSTPQEHPAAMRSLEPLAGNPHPRYPLAEQRRGLEGRVVVKVEVGTDGSVVRASVIESSQEAGFDRAALDAARKWRFRPAFGQDMPQAAVAHIPFVFRIDGNTAGTRVRGQGRD